VKKIALSIIYLYKECFTYKKREKREKTKRDGMINLNDRKMKEVGRKDKKRYQKII